MAKKIIFVIVLLVVLAGCKLRTGPTEKTEGELITPTEAEIHKGFQGLTMEFLKGQPGDSMWEKTEFPITVKVNNGGAHDIQRGILTVVGNLYFSTDPDLQFNLEGKSKFNPEGGFSFEKFTARTVEVDEDKTDTFFVLACYSYKTYASSTICINPRVMEIDTTEEGECKVGSISLPGGQGGPLAVTQVDEFIVPVGEGVLRLNLKIHVSDKGGGRIVAVNSYMKGCGGQILTPKEVGEVKVESIQFSNYRLGIEQEHAIICPNLEDNKFRLNPEGQFIIECWADLDSEAIGTAAYTTPLVTELSYGYTQLSEPKTITIKNSPIGR